MEQNQRKKAREWSGIFADWQKSGESQRGYCRRKEISLSAFGYWHRKLKRDPDDHALVKVGNLATLPLAERKSVTARAGGVLVGLTGRESEDFLIRVFRALKAVS